MDMHWKATLGTLLLAATMSCSIAPQAPCACDTQTDPDALTMGELHEQRVARAEQEAQKAVVQIVALKWGNSGNIAQMVERSLARRKADLRLVADGRTNSVIVSGTEEEVRTAIALITALDVQDEQQKAAGGR